MNPDEFPAPAALDIERLVLGAILGESKHAEIGLGTLTPDDFSTEAHTRVLLACRANYEVGLPIETPAVARRLFEERKLETVGGLTFLTQITDIPNIANLDGYIEILHKKRLARHVVLCAQNALGRIAAGDEPIDVLEGLRASGERACVNQKENFRTPDEIISQIGEQEFFSPKNTLGIETPIPKLSEMMRFTPGSQTILAAITSGGKTAFAAQCAWEAITRGYRIAWYTLEVSDVDNLRRMVGQVGRVNMHRLRMGLYDPDELARGRYALTRLSELSELLMIRNTPITLANVNADLVSLRAKGRAPHLVLVDLLLLVDPPPGMQSRVQEVSYLSRGFKLAWVRHQCAGLVLTHISRKGDDETSEPELNWLKESGSIEQDSDAVIFLHARTKDDRGADERAWRLKLAKNRVFGPTGRVDLTWIKKYATFDSVA